MLNVKLIIVSKMTRHCVGTVQMRGVRKTDKKVRRNVICDDSRRTEWQRRVMEDCSTDERLRQETLCHRQWTDGYIEHPEMMRPNVVVVWIKCLVVDVVCHVV